jgi:hypothetical protein
MSFDFTPGSEDRRLLAISLMLLLFIVVYFRTKRRN